MAETIVHEDYEVSLDVAKPLRESDSVWVDVMIRHVVTGEVIYACLEPYPRPAGILATRDALKSALENACARIECHCKIIET